MPPLEFAEFVTDITSSKSQDCVAGCLNLTSLVHSLMSLYCHCGPTWCWLPLVKFR